MNHARVEVVRNIKSAMGKRFSIILTFAFIALVNVSEAQVVIDIDERINEKLRMKNATIDINKISGYRIQIAFSSDGRKTEKAANKFKTLFPEYSDRVYSLYQQPSYKIRVGDFSREIDTQYLLKQIREHFPNAFPVKDFIKTPNWDTIEE